MKIVKKIYEQEENAVGKRRNCSLRAISPFYTVFKRLVLQTRKNKGSFGKQLTNDKNLDLPKLKKHWVQHFVCQSNAETFISCFPLGYREISVKIFFDLTMVAPVKILILMFLLAK